MKFEGYVHLFGDNIDTDIIIPARFCNTTDRKSLGKHCMHDVYPNFNSRVRPGDILVAGKNFGCGSSREAAVIAIKETGIKCVIAQSFSRIFFRNSINTGLTVIESESLCYSVKNGDKLWVDLSNSEAILSSESKIKLTSFQNDSLDKIIKAGGLINYVKKYYHE